MKRRKIIAVLLVIAITAMIIGCGVSQSDYDKLLAENKRLEAAVSDSAEIITDLRWQIEELKGQLYEQAHGASLDNSGVPGGSSTSETPVTVMVWIPRTGAKYHSKSTCSNMKNPNYVTLELAISLGYTKCSKCW